MNSQRISDPEKGLKAQYVWLWQQLILEFDTDGHFRRESDELVWFGFSDEIDSEAKKFARLGFQLLEGKYSSWPEMLQKLLVKLAHQADLIIHLLRDRPSDYAYVIEFSDGELIADGKAPEEIGLFLDKINPIRKAILNDARILSELEQHRDTTPKVTHSEPSPPTEPQSALLSSLPSDSNAQRDEVKNDPRADVEKFIRRVKQITERKITRKSIWTVAGYTNPTEFERFQRRSPRTTAGAKIRFRRILSMDPKAFIESLDKKRASK